MRSQVQKLTAIGFKKPDTPVYLQHYEELYLYGVLSQLARFSDIQYRDLATLPDKIALPPELSWTDAKPKLQQICSSARTQYLLAGELKQAETIKSDLIIHFLLYDMNREDYIEEETTTLQLDTEQLGDGEAPLLPVEELNRLINLTVNRILRVVYPDNTLPPPEQLAPISTSLYAMKEVLKAHQSTNPVEKVALYEGAIRQDPHIETAFYHLARIYKNEYDYEKSIVFYRETLKISQACKRNKANYATEAGISCALLGRHDLALQWWKHAIEYDPSYIIPYFNIANTYEDQDNFAEAETYFLKAQALAPDDFRTFFNLARIYSKMGIWEKALTQYQHQLTTEFDDPWCHSDVATCYLNLGDAQNAKRHLEKTVILDPEGEAGQYAQLILAGIG